MEGITEYTLEYMLEHGSKKMLLRYVGIDGLELSLVDQKYLSRKFDTREEDGEYLYTTLGKIKFPSYDYDMRVSDICSLRFNQDLDMYLHVARLP